MKQNDFFKLLVPYINSEKIFDKFKINDKYYWLVDSRFKRYDLHNNFNTTNDYSVIDGDIIDRITGEIVNCHFNLLYSPTYNSYVYVYNNNHDNINNISRYDQFIKGEHFNTMVRFLRINEFLL